MLLSDLPDDILIAILRWCLSTDDNKAREIKSHLPLLAVCRPLRRLAIPMVYRHAFIHYGKVPAFEGPVTTSTDMAEPAGVPVKTSLDLIAAAGCASAVKCIQIKIYCVLSPFPGWRDVIRRMRALATKWSVAELTVEMYPDCIHYEHRNGDVSTYADDFAEVINALAALMPAVRRLDCNTGKGNMIARSFYGQLVGQYAAQLHRLYSERPISAPLDCPLTRLQRIWINYDFAADYQLPRVASGELVDMALFNGPANPSWAPFSADSSSHVIEFTKLKKLSTDYYITYPDSGAAVHHRDGHPWELRFPSLRSLEIESTQDICPLLEYAVLPPRMESIAIDIKSAIYQQLANLVLPATKCLSLCVSRTSDGDASGLPAVNRLLERANGSAELKLVIDDRHLPVAPEHVTCTTLTHLAVGGPVSVDTFIGFIQRLQRLVSLACYKVKLGNIQTDPSTPEVDQGPIVESLSTSLRAITVYFGQRRRFTDGAVAVTKYILLRLPMLGQLNAPETPRRSVRSFVKEYAPRYPHLSGITMELYDN